MNEITRRGFLHGMLALAGLTATDLPLPAQPTQEMLEAVPDTAAGDTPDGPCVWFGDLRIPAFNMSVSFQQETIERGNYGGHFLKRLASWDATVHSREMPSEFPRFEKQRIIMEMRDTAGIFGTNYILEGMAYLASYSLCPTTQSDEGLQLNTYEFIGDMPLQMKMR